MKKKTALLTMMCALLVGCRCQAQASSAFVAGQTPQTAASPAPAATPQVVRVEAQPRKKFNYPYYLLVPTEIRADKSGGTPSAKSNAKRRLLVVPNNTGKLDDDLSVHDRYAQRDIANYRNMAARLGVAVLMPAFPRPQTDWRIYTHALDRDSLVTEKKEYRRFDLQLVRMIDDARARLSAEGLRFDRRVLMYGFSAAGMFTNRFVMLHPDRVRAAAIGSPGGWAMAPADTWKGKALRYPIGTADFRAVTGRSLDRRRLRSVPLFLFLGSEDTNDSVIFGDSYEEEDKELILDLFGKTPVERWPSTLNIYQQNLPQATFKLYPGLKHDVTREIWKDVEAFFSGHLRD